MQCVTVKVPGTVEPSIFVLTGHIDHQRFAFPVPVGPAHPTISWGLGWRPHVDDANGARVLIGNQDGVLRLDNLKRVREIRGAWHTRQITLDLRVQLNPIGLILLFFRGHRRQIRDPAAFHYAQPGRLCEYRSQRGHRPRCSCLAFEIPICGVECLPNPAQLGFTIRRPGRPISRGLSSGGRGGQREDNSTATPAIIESLCRFRISFPPLMINSNHAA